MALREELARLSEEALPEEAPAVVQEERVVVDDQDRRAESIIARLPSTLREAAREPGSRRCEVMRLDPGADYPGNLSGPAFHGLIDQFAWKGWRNILTGAARKVAEWLEAEPQGLHACVGRRKLEGSSQGGDQYEVWLIASW